MQIKEITSTNIYEVINLPQTPTLASMAPIKVIMIFTHIGHFVQNHIETIPIGYHTKNITMVKNTFKEMPDPFFTCVLPIKKYSMGPRKGSKTVTINQIILLFEFLNSDFKISMRAINQKIKLNPTNMNDPKNKPPKIVALSEEIGIGDIVGIIVGVIRLS